MSHPSPILAGLIQSCRVKLDFTSHERAPPGRAASYRTANVPPPPTSPFASLLLLVGESESKQHPDDAGRQGPVHSLSPKPSSRYLPLSSTASSTNFETTTSNFPRSIARHPPYLAISTNASPCPPRLEDSLVRYSTRIYCNTAYNTTLVCRAAYHHVSKPAG